MQGNICDFEGRAWDRFCESHPNMRVVQCYIENVSPFRFWSLANQFPDLVSQMHVQVRLIGNFVSTLVYHGSRILMVPFVLFVKRILKV